MSFKKHLPKALFFLLLFSFASNAQEKYHKGILQINSKKSKEAYILIDYVNPQKFQKTITYIDPVVYEKYQFTGKVKSSAKKTFEAKNILGFTLEDGRKFKTIKYRKPTKGLKKTLAPKYCLEQKIEGAIEVFKFYSHTNGGKVTPELLDAMHENLSGNSSALIDYLANNFKLIVKKGEKGTTKNILRMDLMNLIADNSQIVKHYENDDYKVKELLAEDKNEYFLANPKIEAALLQMISEYNTAGIKTSK